MSEPKQTPNPFEAPRYGSLRISDAKNNQQGPLAKEQFFLHPTQYTQDADPLAFYRFLIQREAQQEALMHNQRATAERTARDKASHRR